MSQKVNVLLVDDIDGSDAAETIPFGLDGTRYEIDLNSDHAQELRGQLERYVKAAAKSQGRRGRPGSAGPAQTTPGTRRYAIGPGRRAWMSTTAAASQPTSWHSTRRKPASKPRPVLASGQASSARLLLRVALPTREFIQHFSGAESDLLRAARRTLYRFRTHRRCCSLRFGRMNWLRQDRGLCPFACST